MKIFKTNRIDLLLLTLGTFLFTLGLAMFAYAGASSRLWADDYCYSAVFKQYPFFQAQQVWYQTGGNRFATPPWVALTDLAGIHAPSVLPALVISLWLAGLAVFFVQLWRTLGWEHELRWGAFLASALVFFSVLLAPDRLQTLYWRMGTLHYTLPLAILPYHLALILKQMRNGSTLLRKVGLLLAAGLLGLLAAGLSETFAALQTGLFVLLGMAAWNFLTGEKRRRAWLWCAPGLAASLVAMLLMVLSPSNEWRQAALPPPASAWVLISYTFRYTFDFLRYSLRGQPLPHLILLAMAAVAAFLTLGAAAEKVSWKRLLLVTLIVSFILIGAILCSVAPSVYAGVQYPAPRALMPANFLLLVLLVVIGMAVGLALRMGWKEPARWAMVLALLLMVVLLAYPVRSFSQASADQLTLSVKAARWDARQIQIEAQLSNGQRDLQVKEVDVVQGLEDLGPKPDAWVNQCAAGYYGVHTITALP